MIIQNFRDRRQTIGSTRRVGYNLAGGCQHVMVYTIDNRFVRIVSGGGDDDFASTGIKVLLSSLTCCKYSRTLIYHINFMDTPGQIAWITFRICENFITVNNNIPIALFNRPGKTAMR